MFGENSKLFYSRPMRFYFKRHFVLFAVLLLMAPLAALAQEADTAGVTDTIPPSDVENVRATAGVGKVILQWDAATDDVSVKGYKIYSGTKPVEETDGKYNRSDVRIGKVLKKTIANLKNDTTYYFAVTAIDKSGNESENYSIEVSTTTPFVKPTINPAPILAPKILTPPYFLTTPPAITTNDVMTSDYLDLTGVIKASTTKTGTVFYLHTYDGKRYYMMSRDNWRQAANFSSGENKNKPVRVTGRPAYNRNGKLFGISFTAIIPASDDLGLPFSLEPESSLLQTGIIYSRRVFGKLALYLRSEENGKSYHLLNTPDWQKAVDYMHSGDRVNVYGNYVTNRRGRLFGIRYSDIVPAQTITPPCCKPSVYYDYGHESPIW